MTLSWLYNHRGPYRFCLTRDKGSKAAPRSRFTTEWLKGELEREDVPTDAQALLDDPRDTIVGVNVWSVSENQFIGSFRKDRIAA
jgi:hypothetical protein